MPDDATDVPWLVWLRDPADGWRILMRCNLLTAAEEARKAWMADNDLDGTYYETVILHQDWGPPGSGTTLPRRKR